MDRKNLVIAWYYHLPSVSDDAEIEELIDTSLRPLLYLHKKHRCPFTLAITGSLLERINIINKRIMDLIRELVSENLLEIAGTYFYEIYPLLVPNRYLKLHLKKDIDTKRELLDVNISTFYPSNFAWTPLSAHLLASLGIRSVILDESHYKNACKIQMWKWNSLDNGPMDTSMIDSFWDRRELHYVYEYEVDEQDKLWILFRDFDAVKNISFGSTGFLHRPFQWNNLEKYIQLALSQIKPRKCLTLADDGDRINSVSLYNYSKLLNHIKSISDLILTMPASLKYENLDVSDIPYLPSHSLGGFYSFWLKDLDSIQYLYRLNEVYNSEHSSKDMEKDIMVLQDVYFMFWKNIANKKYYINKLNIILEKLENANVPTKLSERGDSNL